MKVKIVLKEGAALPEYKTYGSAGMDLCANKSGVVPAMGRDFIPSGICLEIPDGYEAQVRPRSGLALRHGIGSLNSPGTIDSDYRGEIAVLLFNFSDKDFVYEKGDRIAQLVFAKVEKAELEQVEILSETDRGAGGFGSTGRN